MAYDACTVALLHILLPNLMWACWACITNLADRSSNASWFVGSVFTSRPSVFLGFQWTQNASKWMIIEWSRHWSLIPFWNVAEQSWSFWIAATIGLPATCQHYRHSTLVRSLFLLLQHGLTLNSVVILRRLIVLCFAVELEISLCLLWSHLCPTAWSTHPNPCGRCHSTTTHNPLLCCRA